MSRRDTDFGKGREAGADPIDDPPAAPRAEAEWQVDSSLPEASHLTELPTVRPEAVATVEDGAESTDLPHPVAEPSEAVPEGGPEDARRRSLTIARKQMLRDRRRLLAQGSLPEIIGYDRPQARSQCRDGKRPCLYVACRYHLYLDVNPRTGSIKINFPDKEIHELSETCALDVAERGGVTLEEVGAIMNLTRERIRQVEASGLEKLRDDGSDLDTFLEH